MNSLPDQSGSTRLLVFTTEAVDEYADKEAERLVEVVKDAGLLLRGEDLRVSHAEPASDEEREQA